MSLDEIEVAKLRWETKQLGRLENLPPWEQPDAPDEQEDEESNEDDEELAISDEQNAMYLGGDCV